MFWCLLWILTLYALQASILSPDGECLTWVHLDHDHLQGKKHI